MTQVPTSESVYYRDRYWNDHSYTIDYMSKLLYDFAEPSPRYWMEYFKRVYCPSRPFARALFINCGNGWADRDLVDLGIIQEGVGFDYSEELLAEARTKASGRALKYFQADCNKVNFEENEFDLVVNVAAMHHVQYIDRMHRLLARTLKPNGLYVNFDYIGPHRNQYSSEHFRLMETTYQSLPEQFRINPLRYPDLQAMLASDPTEAIHSELIIPMFTRYFETLERKDFNGGIAYQIMHNNAALYSMDSDSAKNCVKYLLELDELYTASGQVPALFSFFVGKPKKYVLTQSQRLQEYEKEEFDREQLAVQNAGKYY